MRPKIDLNKTISVIIVTYNRWSLLLQALKSCKMQKNHNQLEVIIVNNGSTDETKRIRDIYPEYTYVEIPQKSISFARNVGLSYSNCEYITFLDSDDILMPNKLEVQYDFMIKNDVDFSFANYHLYTENDLVCYPFDDLKGKFWNKLFPYGATSFMFSKKCLERVPNFDNMLLVGEDWDFFLRCKRNGLKVRNLKEPLFLYRIHDDNISFNKEINHKLFWFLIKLKNRLNPFGSILGYNYSTQSLLGQYISLGNNDERVKIFSYIEKIVAQ